MIQHANLLAIALAIAIPPAQQPDAQPPPVKIGRTVPDLPFKDARFLARNLSELLESQPNQPPPRALLVFVLNTDCPVAKRYIPKILDIHEQYAPEGLRALALYANDGLTVPLAAEHALEHGLHALPVGLDADGSLARALGVLRTPTALLLDHQLRLQYRGRVDDQFRPGVARPAPVRENLLEAVRALLDGKPVPNPETPADGCLLTLPDLETRAAQALALYPQGGPDYQTRIAPVLAKHCAGCHAPGAPAPFPLLTLADARQHARMILEVVRDERMPPWYGSRNQLHRFSNARGLDESEKLAVEAWIAAGTPPENPADKPPITPNPPPDRNPNQTHAGAGAETPATVASPRSPDGWIVGTPDLIITEVLQHKIPATGYLDYQYVIFPKIFTHDTWISAVEIKPDNPAVVHHANLAYATLGKSYAAENFITGLVPGGDPMTTDDGVAYLIPKGSILALQIHFTTTGKPETCRVSLGLKFPKTPVRQRLHHVQVTTSRFRIPPGAPAHPVRASRPLPFDAEILGMFAHMHLRGKDMTFTARLPDGSVENLLTIPNYHFDWQHAYRHPPGAKILPAGTTIDVLAHYDNSPFNPHNPDPAAEVPPGDQTHHEMMFGFVFFLRKDENLDLRVDPRTGAPLPR